MINGLLKIAPGWLVGSNGRLRRVNTPQLLQLAQYMICASSLLLFTTAISSIQQQRQAIQIVSKDAATNVLIAQRLKDAPTGMDAYAVKALLTKTVLNPPSTVDYQQLLASTVDNLLAEDKGKSSNANYAERRQKLAQRLIKAAEHITGNETDQGERRPILTMQLAMMDYLEQLQKAQNYLAIDKEAETLTAYRSAVDILEKSLIPAADNLDKAALSKLDNTYSQQKINVTNISIWLAIAGFAVIAQVIALQLFLSLRTKRTLNLPLLLVTVTIGMFIIWAIVLIQTSSDHLQIAREQNFSSLHSLRQARSLAYSANANESRALLFTTEAAQFNQDFDRNIQKIIAVPQPNLAKLAINTSQGNTSPNIDGFLGNTLNQAFLIGEASALADNLMMLDRYLQTNSQIRSLAKSGQQAMAITLANNQSNTDFNNFLRANQKAIDLNKNAFDQAVVSSFEPLINFEQRSWAVLLSIVFLIFLGLRPRLKEYNFR